MMNGNMKIEVGNKPWWTAHIGRIFTVMCLLVDLASSSRHVTVAEDSLQRSLVSCSSPTLRHGHVTLRPRGTARIYSGDMASLHCDKDYELKLNGFLYSYNYILCSGTGQWTTPHGFPTLPTCQAKVCGPPPVIQFAQIEVNPPLGEAEKGYVFNSVAYYYCKTGYALTNPDDHALRCVNGDWEGERASCQQPCRKPDIVPNSKCTIYTTTTSCYEMSIIPEHTKVYYSCKDGFVLVGEPVRECTDGQWGGERPQCQRARSQGCPKPPSLEHGEYSLYPSPKDAALAAAHTLDGSTAVYSCHNGYTFENDEMSPDLTCHGGRWRGEVPNCVKRLHCNMPQSIPDGNWVILSEDTKFSIGTKIMYECNAGFTPFGSKIIECMDSGYWSDTPPKCLAKGMYCSDPGIIPNGFYVCTPQPCSMVYVGTSVSYVCQTGYEPAGNVQRTCVRGGNSGVWSGQPSCLPIPTTPTADLPLGINSNTMTVVIATSCSVLGLLLVVMVVVALQRRKSNTRLCHPVQQHTPPTYPRPRTDSVDEHDRVALIAFADGVQVVLPSYEEATRGRGGSSTPRYLSDGSSLRRGDYRPLPTIPASMRTPSRHDSPRPGPLAQDHHRNSIITNSSNARDNVSLVFGSMDTMNISDGTSASVTIETFDSGASNPSLALSQRAAAGSLGSSNGSLVNEDAPLLDSGEGNRNQVERSPTPDEQHKQD